MCNINFIDECNIEVGKFDGSDTVSCSGKSKGTRQEFSFDEVFPAIASQENIFEELALLVESALEGYNVCIADLFINSAFKWHIKDIDITECISFRQIL